MQVRASVTDLICMLAYSGVLKSVLPLEEMSEGTLGGNSFDADVRGRHLKRR